tara:strand:+ start:819 stop:1139 length:321 start_codon:yes stop_codon:yes gene_type:complete
MIVATILGKLLSGDKKSSARGAPVAMARKTRDSRKSQAMVRDMMANNARNRGNDKSSAAPRGPTAAQQVAAAKAAKLAARKKKGQAGRKKYEQAMTQAKKMKLLFT